jgi:glycosyltransferase involved in cell wall biosynthesis
MAPLFSKILNKFKKEDESFKLISNSTLPPLSIIIPAYEMKGQGAIHLKRSLDSMVFQTWKNFEVVISDHSASDLIKDAAEEYKSLLDINYIRNELDRGSSCSNANNGIENARYEYVKFLFQDDFLAHPNSLEWAMKFFLHSGKNWLASACNHRKDETNEIGWNHYPRITKGELFEALNSLGCPSVTYMRKSDVRFDSRLPALMDIDYYERFTALYGTPALFNDINVTIGMHSLQITNNGGFGDKVQVEKELQILREKYQVHT